jgi:hypothetical protein
VSDNITNKKYKYIVTRVYEVNVTKDQLDALVKYCKEECEDMSDLEGRSDWTDENWEAEAILMAAEGYHVGDYTDIVTETHYDYEGPN